MLNRIRKITSASSFLVAVTAVLFIFSKFELSKPTKAPEKKGLPVVAVAPVPEPVLPLPRVFSKQRNRSLSQVVKPIKIRPKVARLAKKKNQKVQNQVLLNLAEVGLEEAPQNPAFNIDPYESELRLDPSFELAALYPRERTLELREGLLVANQFEAMKESLNVFEPAPELSNRVESAPETQESIPSPAVSSSDTAPSSDVDEAKSVTTQPPETEEPARTVTNQFNPLQAAPSDVRGLVESGKKLLGEVQNKLIPNPTRSKDANKNAVPGVETLPVTTQPVGKIYGKLTLDPGLRDWVDSSRGHVELKLHRANSSEPQDTFFVDYRYPERDFSWDGREVRGNYQLVATFFKPDQSVAVAQVTYPQVLNDQTAKQMIVFHIKKDQVDESVRSSRASHQRSIVLSGTVFEAASGDHQNAKTITNAEIDLVGMPDKGTFKVDSMGSFRIPGVTSHSEYILSVRAPGYYPTEVIVPTFQTSGYVSVHLVSKDKVDSITRFFTKKPQSEQKSIIMGKVFNPNSRSPVEGEEVLLSGRKGRPLYFGVFPDPTLKSTTETGLFAYLNVEPGFRSVGRARSTAWDLMGTKPNYAYYLETGRGGTGTLKGVIKDPYQNQRVVGLVKIVGSPYRAETNEKGEFEIPEIDLAPGLITLEVEAKDYPTSWHNLSWSPRDGRKFHTLYLPEGDLIEEARQSVARIGKEAHSGMLFGGAEKRFFQNQKSCVTVSLETGDGTQVSDQHGPYPLSEKEFDGSKPLCLSSQRPGFSFYNLNPGQYLLEWKSQSGTVLRSHVVRVGSDRVTILVN